MSTTAQLRLRKRSLRAASASRGLGSLEAPPPWRRLAEDPMSRRAAAPAAAAPTLAKAPAKKRTIQANDEAAQELAERRKWSHAAAAWAFENEVGPAQPAS